VNACGFDSIPADLGCYLMNEEFVRRNWNLSSVRFVLEDCKGTVASHASVLSSVVETYEYSSSFFDLLALLNPFFLNPRDKRTNAPLLPTEERGKKFFNPSTDYYLPVGYDWTLKCFTCPAYLLQTIDKRIVNRSNAMLNWKYGKNFIFTERFFVRSLFPFLFSLVSSLLVCFLLFLAFFAFLTRDHLSFSFSPSLPSPSFVVASLT
jgi:short subunit dehydrogenase-like uncharacterized protein